MTELPITEKQSGCGCGCGCAENLPELDVRAIPHELRHGVVFGALATRQSGEGLVLVASHDPKPLLAQIAQLEGDQIAVEYLVQGPDAWHLRMTRR